MLLSPQQTERFYRIWFPLLHYVNEQRQLGSTFPATYGERTPPLADVLLSSVFAGDACSFVSCSCIWAASEALIEASNRAAAFASPEAGTIRPKPNPIPRMMAAAIAHLKTGATKAAFWGRAGTCQASSRFKVRRQDSTCARHSAHSARCLFNDWIVSGEDSPKIYGTQASRFGCFILTKVLDFVFPQRCAAVCNLEIVAPATGSIARALQPCAS